MGLPAVRADSRLRPASLRAEEFSAAIPQVEEENRNGFVKKHLRQCAGFVIPPSARAVYSYIILKTWPCRLGFFFSSGKAFFFTLTESKAPAAM
jgi:hypothetical protein